jgi:hypothetical protein
MDTIQFHIGTSNKYKKERKRGVPKGLAKLLNRAKPKLLSKAKPKPKAPRLNYNKIKYNPASKSLFKIYDGPRWKIPSSFSVSKSVQYKFDLFTTFKMNHVIDKIKKESSYSIYNVFNTYLKYNTFYKKKPIRLMLQNMRDAEEAEWDTVLKIYRAIFKVIRNLNVLVKKRITNICMKKIMNTEDIITLEVPKQPVYVINFHKRFTYVYEAETLKRSITSRLLISDWMFENPEMPLNVLSNQPFTIGQFISIYSQLKSYGVFSWIFDRFRSCEFKILKFKLRYKHELRMKAIESHFKNEPENCKDTAIDFFVTSALNFGLSHISIERFKNLYEIYPLCNYIEDWVSICKHYYLSHQLNDTRGLAINVLKVSDFMHRYLNIA